MNLAERAYRLEHLAAAFGLDGKAAVAKAQRICTSSTLTINESCDEVERQLFEGLKLDGPEDPQDIYEDISRRWLARAFS